MSLPFKLQVVLALDSMLTRYPLEELSPEEARRSAARRYARGRKLTDYAPLSMAEVREESITVEDGEIPARIYRPSPAANLPILMYFHGGGFVVGDLETHDPICRRLAHTAGCIVISVAYRLAPEYRFPVAHEDCYAATRWAAMQADRFGGNPGMIAVAGDSAGGNLAAAVAMMARDRGGPRLRCQVLVYPVADATMSFPSVDRFGRGYLLTKSTLAWFYEQYVRAPEDRLHPWLSLVRAEELHQLPPALVITAAFDPLRDEGEAYAGRLLEAGNRVEHIRYEGVIHSFLGMPRLLSQSRDAFTRIAGSLQAAFSRSSARA